MRRVCPCFQSEEKRGGRKDLDRAALADLDPVRLSLATDLAIAGTHEIFQLVCPACREIGCEEAGAQNGSTLARGRGSTPLCPRSKLAVEWQWSWWRRQRRSCKRPLARDGAGSGGPPSGSERLCRCGQGDGVRSGTRRCIRAGALLPRRHGSRCLAPPLARPLFMHPPPSFPDYISPCPERNALECSLIYSDGGRTRTHSKNARFLCD